MNKKSKKKNTQSTTVTVTAQPVVESEAEKIWNEIKNLKLEMFALPNQFVHLYYKPITIDPARLYLTALTKATSVLTFLENAVSEKYQVEQIDRFTVLTSRNNK